MLKCFVESGPECSEAGKINPAVREKKQKTCGQSQVIIAVLVYKASALAIYNRPMGLATCKTNSFSNFLTE